MRIIVFLKTISDPYQFSIFQSVLAPFKENGIEMVVIQSELLDIGALSEEDALRYLQFIDADGILMITAAMVANGDIDSAPLKERIGSLPCVSAGYRLNGIPSILIRNRASMEKIVTHLIVDHSCRRLLYIGGPEYHRDNKTREMAFMTTARRYKETYPEIKTKIVHCDWQEYKVFSFLKEYVNENPTTPPDAIIAANDHMAIGVLRYVRSLKDSPWNRCAVTGFDDIPEAALQIPSLTTVLQPFKKMGELATHMLQELICGSSVPEKVYIDTEVRIRSSCGCETEKSVSDEDKNKAQNRIHRLSLQKFKNDYYVYNVSDFARRLTDTDTYQKLCECLDVFLEYFEIENFYLVSFKRDTQNAKWYTTGKADLMYSRENYTVSYNGGASNRIELKSFFSQKLKSESCIAPLTAEKTRIGFVLYDANEQVQPYLASAVTFIENTMRRIEVLDAEKIRASELEEEVMLRTADLRNANRKLKEEAARRIAVEAEVLRISELERLRFSLDLHDDICQRLAGISMYCQSILKTQTMKRETIEDLSQMLDETLTRTRSYAHDFFPLELDTLGLNEALESLCVSVEKQTGCVCRYEWALPDTIPLSVTQKLNVYRIFQEAMHNVMKHSKATETLLSVTLRENGISVRLSDNGVGMTKKTTKTKGESQKKSGLGLHSMEYRAHQIGADYTFESVPGKGTSVEILIPLE